MTILGNLVDAADRLLWLRQSAGLSPLMALLLVVAEWEWRNARHRRSDGSSKGGKPPSARAWLSWLKQGRYIDSVTERISDLESHFKKPLSELSEEELRRARRWASEDLVDLASRKTGRPLRVVGLIDSHVERDSADLILWQSVLEAKKLTLKTQWGHIRLTEDEVITGRGDAAAVREHLRRIGADVQKEFQRTRQKFIREKQKRGF